MAPGPTQIVLQFMFFLLVLLACQVLWEATKRLARRIINGLSRADKSSGG